MKKNFKYFSLVFILLLLFITGCGKKDPEKQLKDAIEKTENANSVKMKFGLNYGIEMQGISMNMSFTGDQDIYKENEESISAHGTYKIGTFGMNQSSESYVTLKDGYLYTYVKDEDGQWTYSKIEYKNNNDYKDEVIKVLDSATKVKSEKSDKKGYEKLSVTLNIDGVLKQLDGVVPKDSIDEINKQLDKTSIKDFKITIYLKDGYISIVEMNLDDILKNMLKDISDEYDDINFNGLLTIVMYDYNKVSKIEIPDDVINNAKEAEKDFNFNVNDFMNSNNMDELF
jgi:hypothetical protein